jgi:hypothetical protein
MHSRRLHCFCLAIGLAALGGCADQYKGRYAVSGTVQLENQPLKDGRILFVPLEQQGSQQGAQITGGRYDIPKSHGLMPGKYLVRISAGDGRTPWRRTAAPKDAKDKSKDQNQEAADDKVEEAPPGPGGPLNIVSFDLIPDEWSARSDKQIEVTASGANTFDFSIPKANKPRGRR